MEVIDRTEMARRNDTRRSEITRANVCGFAEVFFFSRNFRTVSLNFSLNGELLSVICGTRYTSCRCYLRDCRKNNAGNFIGRLIKRGEKKEKKAACPRLRNADVSRCKHECSGRYTLIRSAARIPSLPESTRRVHPFQSPSRNLLPRFPALPAAAPLPLNTGGMHERKIAHAGVSDR